MVATPAANAPQPMTFDAGLHQFVSSFTTDSAGNATFTGSITVASVAAAIDNEVILHGEVPSRHQYIRQLFAPCAES